MNKIYLDMDGVVADFRGNALIVLGRETPHGDIFPDAEWNILRENQHLFRHLPLMSRAHELVDIARQYRDRLGWEILFLTAIPHNNDLPWAFYDKAAWALDHFPDIPVHFGPYSVDKHLHCSPGDILVDDRRDNCQDWERAGGSAFRVGKTLDSVIAELSEDLETRQQHALATRRLLVEIL